jgi:hypothetical protein
LSFELREVFSSNGFGVGWGNSVEPDAQYPVLGCAFVPPNLLVLGCAFVSPNLQVNFAGLKAVERLYTQFIGIDGIGVGII